MESFSLSPSLSLSLSTLFAAFNVTVAVKRRVSLVPKQLELRPQIDARRDRIDSQTFGVDRLLKR